MAHDLPLVNAALQADAQLAERYYAHDKTLWGIFVHGAPAYLTNNINPSRGLSNGTPVRMDSLGFHPGNAMELQQYNQLLADIANARPGEEVVSALMPTSINCSVRNESNGTVHME